MTSAASSSTLPAPFLFGVIGHPISHSLSPHLHRLFFEVTSVAGAYYPFDVHPTGLKDWVSEAQRLGLGGFNVTIPHKVSIIDTLDVKDPTAQLIGSVNTVWYEEGQSKGINTDAVGFISVLSKAQREALKGKHCIILGSGGASRAVGLAILKLQPAKVTLVARNLEKAEGTLNQLTFMNNVVGGGQVDVECISFDTLTPEHLSQCSLVVNTTPVGMQGDQTDKQNPLNPNQIQALPDNCLVYDLVYRPLKTPLLDAAEARGLTTLDGLGMLIGQGAASFKIWTGLALSQDALSVVRHYLMKCL